MKCPLRAAQAILASRETIEEDENEECKRRIRESVRIAAAALTKKGEIYFPLLTFGEEEREYQAGLVEERLELAEVERVVQECRFL